jgi:hypothetical protein
MIREGSGIGQHVVTQALLLQEDRHVVAIITGDADLPVVVQDQFREARFMIAIFSFNKRLSYET